MPFFISGYNVDLEPGRSDVLTCWEDILPTIVGLAGVEVLGPVDGIDLSPTVAGGTPPERESLYGVCAGRHFVVFGRHKYLWFEQTNEEQVFDMADDPEETQDLSTDAGLLAPLREAMATHLVKSPEVNYHPAALRPCANRPPEALFGARN